MYAILAITRFTFIESIRNRIFLVWLVVLAMVLIAVQFLGALAITESLPIKTSLLAASLRLIAVFFSALYVCNSVMREINDKVLQLTLAMPISRGEYLIAKLAAYALIGFCFTLLIGLALSFYAPFSALFSWLVSLYCELLIIIALSLFCAYSFSQLTVALSAVVAFYVLARSMGTLQILAHNSLINTETGLAVFVGQAIDALALLLPDLYRFGRTDWLIYSDTVTAPLAPILIETVIFVLLLISATLFDLYRKNI